MNKRTLGKTLCGAAASSALFLAASCGEVNNARDAAKKSGLKFGFAASVANLSREADRKIIAENSSILVAENCMKFGNIHPTMRIWNWADTDNTLDFAAKNKIDVKLHTLVWHTENPSFIRNLKTKEEAQAAMDAHIEGILEHCKDKITCCDVVNEMFEEDGSMRETVWFKTMGKDYVEYALEKAHKVAPKVKLYLNEYNNEAALYPKADAMYEMVKDFVERGVPIDGVGMQLHIDATGGYPQPYDEDAVRENVRRYAKLGIEVSFSEVDVRIPNMGYEEWEAGVQKDIYCSLMKIALEEPNVKSFLVWGLSDKESWVPVSVKGFGHALLFDDDFMPKPIFNELVNMMAKYKGPRKSSNVACLER